MCLFPRRRRSFPEFYDDATPRRSVTANLNYETVLRCISRSGRTLWPVCFFFIKSTQRCVHVLNQAYGYCIVLDIVLKGSFWLIRRCLWVIFDTVFFLNKYEKFRYVILNSYKFVSYYRVSLKRRITFELYSIFVSYE